MKQSLPEAQNNKRRRDEEQTRWHDKRHIRNHRRTNNPGSILYKSKVGRYPDGSITARYRFIKNASWDSRTVFVLPYLNKCYICLIFNILKQIKLYKHKWAIAWQNLQNGMCAQRRLRLAWASAFIPYTLFYTGRFVGYHNNVSSIAVWFHIRTNTSIDRSTALLSKVSIFRSFFLC